MMVFTIKGLFLAESYTPQSAKELDAIEATVKGRYAQAEKMWDAIVAKDPSRAHLACRATGNMPREIPHKYMLIAYPELAAEAEARKREAALAPPQNLPQPSPPSQQQGEWTPSRRSSHLSLFRRNTRARDYQPLP